MSEIKLRTKGSGDSGTVGHKGRAKARDPRYPESPEQDPPEIKAMVDQQKLALRLRLGLNGKQFARLVGCSVSTLSRWEHGHAEPDGALLAIVEAFDAATAPNGALGPQAARDVADMLRAYANGSGLGDVLRCLLMIWGARCRDLRDPAAPEA